MTKKKNETQKSEVKTQVEMNETNQVKSVEANKEEIEKKRFLYIGKTITIFRIGSSSYMLIPNSTYTGLPDCPQVRELIEKNLLKEV